MGFPVCDPAAILCDKDPDRRERTSPDEPHGPDGASEQTAGPDRNPAARTTGTPRLRRGPNDRQDVRVRMRTPFPGGVLVLLLGLAACGPTVIPAAPGRADLGAGLVRPSGASGPPKGPEGACWTSDLSPAVIETVTEQVVDRPEKRDASGNVTQAASFRTETRQQMVRERSEVWFRVPCPDVMDVDFVATLQRALKARGYYRLPLSGVMDAATRDAIRRFQSERGLDIETLSLGAAQELGIVPTGLDEIERQNRRGGTPRRR